MSDNFIHKIEEVIFRNLANEKFGVLDLAREVGFSRSQTLRKIKASTGKSVNQLIREIRLSEACKMLQHDDLTASEIAYNVGFSSPSYFNKCFLDQYGITPGEYKRKIEAGENTELSDQAPRLKWWTKKPILGALLAMIIILAGYLALIMPKDKTSFENASIAVLPFQFLSENQDKEYLADGITEAITFELYKNTSIRVISRGSAMIYKGKQKLYPQIARELDVDLLLEGSVIYDDDSMRVVVQLIDPLPQEEHVWAGAYDQDSGDVLQLISQVSNEIAGEISKITGKPMLKVEEAKVSPAAYDLYLRGRHLLNTQKIRYNSLIKGIDYLKEANHLAPDFAPAYTALAEGYLAVNTLIGDNEEKNTNRENAREAIGKSLKIDPHSGEAYITEANLRGKLNWEWDEMKLIVERGLVLEPNNAKAHLILSDYYVVTGQYSKAIEEALKAENLDPVNPETGCVSADRYYISGKYDQAIQKYLEVIELNPNYGFAWNGLGFAYYQAGEKEKAVETWLQLQHIMGNQAMVDCYNSDTFENCLHFWLVGATKNEPRYCSNPVIIASVYMLLNDQENALKYLGIAADYKNEDLPVMITYPDFYPLHESPVFRELVSKVGVVIPD